MRESPLCLQTERLCLTLPTPEDAADVLAYYRRNEEHLRAWSPPRTADFLTESFWKTRLQQSIDHWRTGAAVQLYVWKKDAAVVIGNVGLTNIIRGPLQSCNLGYGIDARHEGQGLMYEAVKEVIAYAFTTLRLHRLEAGHRPENERSAKLLQRLGFERQGYARAYLFIDGAWRDHVLNALINEAMPGPT